MDSYEWTGKLDTKKQTITLNDWFRVDSEAQPSCDAEWQPWSQWPPCKDVDSGGMDMMVRRSEEGTEESRSPEHGSDDVISN